MRMEPSFAAVTQTDRGGKYLRDIGVFASFDQGATWSALGEGLPPAVMVFDLEIYEPERLLRAATHGNGAYELSLSQLSPTPRRPGSRRR